MFSIQSNRVVLDTVTTSNREVTSAAANHLIANILKIGIYKILSVWTDVASTTSADHT